MPWLNISNVIHKIALTALYTGVCIRLFGVRGVVMEDMIIALFVVFYIRSFYSIFILFHVLYYICFSFLATDL